MAEMTIRRFGVVSVAKMYGLLTFIVGLLIGVIYGLFFMIFGAAMSAFAPGGSEAAAGGISSVVIGLLFMIGFPVFYGLMGFIAGAIGALIYNGFAGIVGGVKFELEGVQQEYAPPPPPQQWAPNQYPAQ
jgi:hypothetical protein